MLNASMQRKHASFESVLKAIALILLVAHVHAAPDSSCPYLKQKQEKQQSLAHLAPSIQEASKTIYILPYARLVDRLSAVASALTIASEKGFNAVVVWNVDKECDRTWPELFSSPEVPLGSLPVGYDGCEVHEVASDEDFEALLHHHSWHKLEDGKRALCIASSDYFVKDTRDLKWFYELLVPSQRIMDIVTDYQEFQFWSKWGQWIGMHLCSSANCRSSAGSKKKVPTVQAFITMARELESFPVDGETVPRFFVVGDYKSDALALQSELWTWNMTGIKGAAVSYPGEYVNAKSAKLSEVELQLLQLYLLSRTSLVVGSASNKFSEAAHAMGHSFYLSLD